MNETIILNISIILVFIAGLLIGWGFSGMKQTIKKQMYKLEDYYSNSNFLKLIYIKPLKKIYRELNRFIAPKYTIVDGMTIYLDRYDGTRIDRSKDQNSEGLKRFLRKNIKEGDTVLNIGANLGVYSLTMSKYVGEKGLIYSFEPSGEIIKLFKKSIKANNIKNIIPIQKAVSNESGKLKLFIDKYAHGDTRLFDTKEGREFEEVDVITVDDFIKYNDIKKVDFVLMDTQGCDYNIFEGMKETIKNNPQIKIVSEFAPYHLRGMGRNPVNYLKSIQNNNFNLYHLDEGELEIIKDLELFTKEKEGVDGDIFYYKKNEME